jgi:type II secretory pathway component PulF
MVDALQAAALSEHSALARLYRRLANRLAIGDSLGTALRATLSWCPGDMIGAIDAAEQGGTLPAVLQTLAADARRDVTVRELIRVPSWYAFFLLFVLPAVLTFVMIVIVPKFFAIFQDFNAPLPAITLSLLALCRFLANTTVIWLPALIILLLLGVQTSILRHYMTRIPGRFQPLFALWDTLVWLLPGARAVARSSAARKQLPVLHAAVRAGHDLHEAAYQAGHVAVNLYARRRLLRWAEALERGADPADAAREAGLPAPLVRALAGAGSPTALAGRLEYVAEYYRAVGEHWQRIVWSVFVPVFVTSVGLVVAYVALAMLLPLVSLIESVSGDFY